MSTLAQLYSADSEENGIFPSDSNRTEQLPTTSEKRKPCVIDWAFGTGLQSTAMEVDWVSGMCEQMVPASKLDSK